MTDNQFQNRILYSTIVCVIAAFLGGFSIGLTAGMQYEHNKHQKIHEPNSITPSEQGLTPEERIRNSKQTSSDHKRTGIVLHRVLGDQTKAKRHSGGNIPAIACIAENIKIKN